MDAQLPPRICATSRGMATLRVGLRHRIDCLWQARAEKQRRLRLGLVDLPSTSPRSTAFSLSDVNSTSPSEYGETLTTDTSRMPQGENITEDADHVGTLLVRMGQLDGVGGVGLLSLTPKAVATLVLEESSASVEEMNMETNTTKVQAVVLELNCTLLYHFIIRLSDCCRVYLGLCHLDGGCEIADGDAGLSVTYSDLRWLLMTTGTNAASGMRYFDLKWVTRESVTSLSI